MDFIDVHFLARNSCRHAESHLHIVLISLHIDISLISCSHQEHWSRRISCCLDWMCSNRNLVICKCITSKKWHKKLWVYSNHNCSSVTTTSFTTNISPSCATVSVTFSYNNAHKVHWFSLSQCLLKKRVWKELEHVYCITYAHCVSYALPHSQRTYS